MDLQGRNALAHIVFSLAQDINANVSSLYSWHPEKDMLRLEATHGLAAALVGKLTMTSSEGLTGLVVQKSTPISIKYPANHPRYKFVPNSAEERLLSYLGVPIGLRGRGIIGVVTVQTESAKMFSMTEIEFVVHAADRIAPIMAAALEDDLRLLATA